VVTVVLLSSVVRGRTIVRGEKSRGLRPGSGRAARPEGKENY